LKQKKETDKDAKSISVSKEVQKADSTEIKKEPQEQEDIKSGRSVRYIDTKTVAVDLGKFDERLENLAPDKAKAMDAGKQKIKKNVGINPKSNSTNLKRQRRAPKKACDGGKKNNLCMSAYLMKYR
jgi:translation initiation factor IF-2